MTRFDMRAKGLLVLAFSSFIVAIDAAEAGTGCTSIATERVADLLVPNVYALGPDIDRGLGGADFDRIQVEFYSLASGSFALGTGLNSNYATCEQCLLLLQDAESANPTIFFADSGELVINQAPGTVSLPIDHQAVRLIEVTIDPFDFSSTPVPDGACLLLFQDILFEDGFETVVD